VVNEKDVTQIIIWRWNGNTHERKMFTYVQRWGEGGGGQCWVFFNFKI